MLKIKVVIDGDDFHAEKIGKAMIRGLREDAGATPWVLEIRRPALGEEDIGLIAATSLMMSFTNEGRRI